MGRKVLIGVPNFSKTCKDATELLINNGFTIDENPYKRTFQFHELEPIIGDYDAMISELEIWNEALFYAAKKMKILARNGVGLDNIDLNAAKNAGVCITYAKGLNAVSVANMAIALMLTVLRKTSYFDSRVRKGFWDNDTGNDLDGRKVGFLGFGEIARMTARRLSGFDVEMLAYDKYQTEADIQKASVKKVSFETILLSCNTISLHLPYNNETHHIITEKEFAMMRSDTILINTARGKLVCMDALYNALCNRKIFGAGIDVYENEPVDPESKLLTLQNVVLTPHVSGHTVESCARVGYQVAKDIISFFNGETPELLVL